MTTKYHLYVEGRAWGGFNSEYTYNLTEKEAAQIAAADDPRPLVKRKAGDFETVTYFHVGKETIMVTTETLVERNL